MGVEVPSVEGIMGGGCRRVVRGGNKVEKLTLLHDGIIVAIHIPHLMTLVPMHVE